VVKGSKLASSTDGSNSRDVILDSARALITSKGYDGMAISDLTERSGLPASSIYYHFGNKLGVLAALLDRTFMEMHASFPAPSSFDDQKPLERFETWVRAACTALDQRPEYLRILLAISIGPHKDTEPIRTTVRRIRDFAHASWVEALTPVFGQGQEALIDHLAVLGRAVIDGLSVTNSFDGVKYSSHIAAFVALVRSLADQPDAGALMDAE
jgi:AcrR family transcriptional regulator